MIGVACSRAERTSTEEAGGNNGSQRDPDDSVLLMALRDLNIADCGL